MKHVQAVVLQHGYHGAIKDFQVLAASLQRSAPSLIVIEPTVNHGFSTDDSILTCGKRLSDYLATRLTEIVADERRRCCSSGDDHLEVVVALHLHFVCHSMGGLIARAALPAVQAMLAGMGGLHAVHYGYFCTVCTPHLGVTQMPSRLRFTLARGAAVLWSSGLHDLLRYSDVISTVLLSDPFMKAWRVFEQRVGYTVLNDNTVPPYSSGFVALPDEVAASMRSSAGQPCTRSQTMSSSLCADWWPDGVLPQEREMAARLLAGAGPIEQRLVDLRPLLTDYEGPDAGMAHRGAHTHSHRAIICKEPYQNLSHIFGGVTDEIVQDILKLCSSEV